MDYAARKLGQGKPKITIIGCMHGDEIIGKLVIEKLKKIKLKKGTLTLITANCKALKQNKRYIEKDLNRSFTGKKGGKLEECIAFELEKILKSQDAVLDVHATNSDFKELVLLHHLNQSTKQILRFLPIRKVARVGKNIYNGCSLLHCCKNAVCLEFGSDKSGRNYKQALSRVKRFLINLGMLAGQKRRYLKKELYVVNAEYAVDQDFMQAKTLKDFQKIKKGRFLGSANGRKFYSEYEFYPIFLAPGRYENTLALVGKKKQLKL